MPDRRMLNAVLIENGLSEHDDRWGHEQADAYDELERQARKGRRGLWDR